MTICNLRKLNIICGIKLSPWWREFFCFAVVVSPSGGGKMVDTEKDFRRDILPPIACHSPQKGGFNNLLIISAAEKIGG